MKWTSLLLLISLTASAQTNILTGRRVGVELRTNMVPYVTMGTVVEVRDPHDGTILRVIIPEPFTGPPALPASAPGTLVTSTNVLRRMPPALPTPLPRKARAALAPKSQHIGSIVCTKNNGGMIYHDGVKWVLTNAMPVPRFVTNAMLKVKVLPNFPAKPLPHGRIVSIVSFNTGGTTVFPSRPFLADRYDDTEPSTRILYTDVTGLVAGRHYQLLGSIDAKTWQTIDAIDWTETDPSSYWRSADAVTRTANFGEMLKIVSP